MKTVLFWVLAALFAGTAQQARVHLPQPVKYAYITSATAGFKDNILTLTIGLVLPSSCYKASIASAGHTGNLPRFRVSVTKGGSRCATSPMNVAIYRNFSVSDVPMHAIIFSKGLYITQKNALIDVVHARHH